MKKTIFLLPLMFFSCGYIPPVLHNINLNNFDIKYSKPIYYKLGDNIYYSKDINISREDKLICNKSYRGGHVSPDYNYIIVQGENAVLLYDKNGNKIKEFQNCYFDLIQWGPASKQILILKKVNKKISLFLYNMSTGLEKKLDEDIFKGQRWRRHLKLNNKKVFMDF